MENHIIISKKTLLLLWCVLALSAYGQRRFRVMEYNVENLFDTVHAEGKADMDFLPASERGWNSARYWKKLGLLCRVIAAAGGESPVDLVALCEVGNDSVLAHLTQRTLLRRLDYSYVVTDGPDSRGINVALLYQRGSFRPLHTWSVRVPCEVARERPTRDILCVSGMLPTGDTLDVFVCHFPSRSGGVAETEPFRKRAAAVVRAQADSLLRCRVRPRLLLMGDFNEGADEKALRDILGVIVPDSELKSYSTNSLYSLSQNLYAAGGVAGTYKYKGNWDKLDQIIVSGLLLNPSAGFHTSLRACRILCLPFLVERDGARGGVKPKRTYQGPVYRGGCSDHLPLCADFHY